MKTPEQIQSRIDVLTKSIDERYKKTKPGLGQSLCKAIDYEIKEKTALEWVLQDDVKDKANKIFEDYFKQQTGKAPTKNDYIKHFFNIKELEQQLINNEI